MTTTITEQLPMPQPDIPEIPQQSTTAGSPQQIVLQAGFAYIVSACLNVAVKLRIPDLIGDTVKDIGLLAREAGVDKEYLFRVLRVLEMNQIVACNPLREFELTPAGQLLRRGSPGSLAAAIEWIADPLHLSLYSHLKGSIEKGQTTFDTVNGKPFFDWLSESENADEAAVFNNAMTSISEMCIPAFLDAYDFGAFTKIVDVGGGHGAVLRAILRKHKDLRGAIADLSPVISGAKEAIAYDSLANRCEAIECNFFEAVPAGADGYLMKNIVHDWADVPALRLLRNVRDVIPSHGKLLLAEAVINDSPKPHLGKLLDIEMIAFVGGKERTQEEFRKLLGEAGFTLEKVISTASPLSLLEAVPVKRSVRRAQAFWVYVIDHLPNKRRRWLSVLGIERESQL